MLAAPSQIDQSAPVEIEARGLTKLYGDFPALHKVNLEVRRGEYLALLGRNGAGKSTLLKLLAMLTSPSLGTLKIGGIDRSEDRDKISRRLGMLGHDTFLYDELTAEENLLFYAALYSIATPAPKVLAMLESVGLCPFRREMVRNFSRGMRQRLSIGRMFLHDPDILLLDEPFNGLDDKAVLLLEERLKTAHESGKTIILCTHQLELALKSATSILIMEKGKVAYLGPNQPGKEREMREIYVRFAG